MVEVNHARIVGASSKYSRSKGDFYPTPPEVTQALLDFLQIPAGKTIWECACGEGHMVAVMKQNGYKVIGTDIIKGDDYTTMDIPQGVDWVITNPPFSMAERFIRRSAEHGKPFAMLLKSSYWHAKTRLQLFQENPPMYVLPLTWRPNFCFGTRGGSPLMDVIWCVWGAEKGMATPSYIPLAKPNLREKIVTHWMPLPEPQKEGEQ